MDTPYSARPAQAPVGEQVFREVTLNTFNTGFTHTISSDISTSANYGTVLAAETGYRWVLAGGYIHAFVLTTLAGGVAAEAILYLHDGLTPSAATVVWPIGNYEANNTGGRGIVGTVITDPRNGAPVATNPDRGGVISFDFSQCPQRSIAVGNGLFVRGSSAIGLGVIRVMGAIWGWKESGSP